MSVVVATDFSPCSQTAVRLATAIARKRGTSLLLVHAIEPFVPQPLAVPVSSLGWEAELLKAAEAVVARDAGDIRQQGVRVDSRVVLGSASSEILEVAKEHAAELIVLGTHGRKQSASFFLGSVAAAVARSAACPVLVTRESPADAKCWQGESPLRLAVGADGSSASQAAISCSASFAGGSPTDVSVVRVYRPSEEAMRYGLDDPWGGPDNGAQVLPLLERDVGREALALLGRTPDRIRYRAVDRDAADALAEEAVQLGADAIVVGVPRHRSFRWTVLAPASVLRASTLPVLCVPEATAAHKPDEVTPVRSVLIATDLSSASKVAVPRAYGLLRPAGGRVEICYVHVVGPVNALAETPMALAPDDDERHHIETQLRALIPPDAHRFGITTGVSVVEGRFAAEAILAAAARFGVDLLAVGSHGRSGIRRAVLGSVAEEIARHSSRPVLIVRGPSGSDAA
jgi:nucleotide-binding universal stress UspA family protein